MLQYEYINKEWIISATARRVYRAGASASLGLFLLLIAIQQRSPLLSPFRPILRLLLLVGVIGYATTLVGMEYFLFRFDNSAAWKQVLWFCIVLIPLIGVALYCFFVYSRSDAVQGSPASQPRDASG